MLLYIATPISYPKHAVDWFDWLDLRFSQNYSFQKQDLQKIEEAGVEVQAYFCEEAPDKVYRNHQVNDWATKTARKRVENATELDTVTFDTWIEVLIKLNDWDSLFNLVQPTSKERDKRITLLNTFETHWTQLCRFPKWKKSLLFWLELEDIQEFEKLSILLLLGKFEPEYYAQLASFLHSQKELSESSIKRMQNVCKSSYGKPLFTAKIKKLFQPYGVTF